MKYSRNFLSTYLSILLDIKEKRFLESTGICRNIYEMAINSTHLTYAEVVKAGALSRNIFNFWPKFSGSYLYPIRETHCSYEDAIYDRTLWDKNNPYGKLRWELLDFMIGSVQDMIDFIDETIEEDEESI